jgi:hypothetical protein
MKDKVEELNRAIRTKAADLGLIFVNGPDPASVDADGAGGLHPSYDTTNYQRRAVYGFGVAEAN